MPTAQKYPLQRTPTENCLNSEQEKECSHNCNKWEFNNIWEYCVKPSFVSVFSFIYLQLQQVGEGFVVNLCLCAMSPSTSLSPYTHIFCKKIVRQRSKRKWKLRVRHVSQQHSSIKGNYSAALEINQKETNPGFTALVSYFGWIRSKPKSDLSRLEERVVLSHVVRHSNASNWGGSVPQLPPLFVINPHAGSVCTRETHYPQLFVFQGLVCRIADPGWPSRFLQWRGSHVALQALPSLSTGPLWIPYGSWTISCGLDNHQWTTSLGITAGGVCILILIDTSSRWVAWT